MEQIAYQDVRVPGTFLVRPNGAVRLDSITPFSFGRVEDGLASCWRRIAADWRHQDILDWAGGMKSSSDLGDSAVVPYADDEVEVGSGRLARARAKLAPRLPKRGADSTVPPPDAGDVATARAAVLDRLRARRHRAAPLRWAGSQDDERLVRLISNGKVFRLSRTAGQLLDALDGATVGEALDELAARYPDVDPATLERDTGRDPALAGRARRARAGGQAGARAVAEAREPVPVAGP